MGEPSNKKAKSMPVRAPRVRFTIQLEVEPGMEERLERVKSSIQRVKSALSIHSRTPQGNFLMMERLLDVFEGGEQNLTVSYSTVPSEIHLEKSEATSVQKSDASVQTEIPTPYVLASGENTTGSFDIHTPSKMDENYFLASYDSVQRLVSTMMYYGGKCPLCGYHLELSSYEVQQHGHCARVSMNCAAGHSLRWFSSGIVSGKFTANLRLVFFFIYF